MADSDIQFSKRFSKNLATNIIYFIINVAIGIAITPYFLNTLGPVSYALIPLATSITSYVVLVIDAVNSSVSRFLTIDIQKNNDSGANKTFNTAVFGTLIVILCILPVALIIAWFSPALFSIGENSSLSVFILFALVFISALIRAWNSNFMVTLFARNRIDLRNYVNIINIVSQVVILVLLFTLFSPTIEFVGISYCAAAVIALFISIIFSRKVCPNLHLNRKDFSKSIFKDISGMSFWILTDSVGVLLRYQIALMIVNIYFGEIMETEYSLCLQWFTLLVSLASLVSNLFTPLMYSYYAKGEVENMYKFSSFSTKIMGLAIALPIALVCIFTPQLMTIWVGESYAHLSVLVWIIVAPVLFKIQAGCISPIYGAFNKVRIPALVNIAFAVITPVMALTLPLIGNLGYYGVAISCSFSIIFIAVVMIPLYTAHILKKHLASFYKSILPGFISLVVLFIGGYAIANLLMKIMNQYAVMIGLSIVIAIIYTVFISRAMLNAEERSNIRVCLPGFLNKIIPKWLL